MPSNVLWKLVLDEQKKTHWGADALYKQLNQKIVSQNLYTTMKQVTQRCEICLKNNPNTSNRIQIGVIGKGNSLGQHWQIDFSELPRKGGIGTYWY